MLPLRLCQQVAGDDRWMNQRSPHGLMVDCIYLCAKRRGIKTSAIKVRDLTFQIFGVGTQPLIRIGRAIYRFD